MSLEIDAVWIVLVVDYKDIILLPHHQINKTRFGDARS